MMNWMIYSDRGGDMTIDEAIKFCHEKSENIKLKADPQVFVDIAEWLAELKEYKEEVVYKEYYEQGKQDGYNKGIDDYVEELKETYKPCKDADNYMYTNVCRRFDDIAEQLKAGGTDGTSTTNA